MKFTRISVIFTDTKLILFTQVMNAVIALVFTLTLAKYGLARDFGFCVITIFALSVLLDVVDFGACSKYSRELAGKRISKKQYFAVMNRKSLALCMCIPVIVSSLLYSNQDLSSAVLFSLYPIFWTRQNYIQQYLMTKGLVHPSLRLQLADRLCWFCAIPLVFLSFGYNHVYVIPILFGLALHNIWGTLAVKRDDVSWDDFFTIRSSRVSDTRHFGVLSIMSDLANMDIAVVARYADSAGAGTYTLSQRFRTPITMVFQSIVTQLKPLTAARESSQIKQLFRSESPLLLSGVASLFIAALFSRIYADDIFGTSYESIEVVLPVGILIGVPSGIVAITSAFLASAGHERRVSILTTSWVFLMLSCLAAFTFMFGILGAILTMFALNVALAVIFLFMSAKVWKKEFI